MNHIIIMKNQTFLCLILGLLALLSSSQGLKFDVGGREGWVLNPSENYNHWAERNRFQVNDTLCFKYKKENDSVMVVSRENYNQCNIKNPIKSLTITGDESEFKFERSGPHYFISGNEEHCKKGQKIIIVVLAIRPKKTPPSPPSPAPMLSPPSPSPEPSPSASITPSSSPSVADAPTSDTKHKKSNALGVTTLSPGMVVSLVVGVAMFLGCFGWLV